MVRLARTSVSHARGEVSGVEDEVRYDLLDAGHGPEAIDTPAKTTSDRRGHQYAIAIAVAGREMDGVAQRGTYRQIADELRGLIASGRLQPGALVPSELALAEQHDIARGTVRAALALLVDEGMIEVVPGQASRVVGSVTVVPMDTAWGKVATSLRERLEAGEFAPDMPMPSEATLVAEFSVSRNTARRAYQHLVDAGLVVIRQGSEAFPAPR